MKNILCWLFITAIAPFPVNAQNFTAARLDELAGKFINKLHENNTEKIVLQTDRNVYVAGEKIWFKAYLLSAVNNHLDTLSKNLLVDIVDDDDSVISHVVLNAALLRTNGVLDINDSVKTGIYWLRCYTQTMATADTQHVCVRPVLIKNLYKNNVIFNLSQQKAMAEAGLTFFPEGGFLITNINSAGVIQVHDEYGKGFVAEGNIVNEKDSLVTHFTTNKYGLAKIDFYPLPEERYFAQVTTQKGVLKCSLPGYNPYMAQIAVENQSSNIIHARVALEDALASPKFATYILAISGDSVCFTGIGKGMYSLDIPTDNFPGGVATLMLFDARLHLLSERKVFINKDNYRISIKQDRKDYHTREKAHLDIAIADINNNPLIASFNISVQDERLTKMSDEVNEDSVPPLDADKLGDWIKRNKNEVSPQDIDLLLIAQQPEFVNWQNLDINHFVYNDSTLLLQNLAGKVVDKKNMPVQGRIITAISLNGFSPYFAVDTTKQPGSFQLPLPEGNDSLTLEVKLTNKHDIRTRDSILINNFSFPPLVTPGFVKAYFLANSSLTSRRIAQYHIDTFFTTTGKEWLKPVVVTAIAKKQADYDESKRISPFSFILSGARLGHGAPDEIYNQLLTIPGVSEINGHLTIYGVSDFSGGGEPVAVLNGIVQDLGVRELLATLNFREIDFIEILRGADAGIYGVRAGHGAIVINTRSRARELPGFEGAEFKIVTPLTYHTSPSLKMPDYGNPVIKNNKLPDPRTTIYWNGNLLTTTDGKAAVDFYTADEAANYVITVSGVAANGEVIYKRITLKVQ